MSDLALAFVLPPIRDPKLEVLKYRNFLKALLNRKQRAVRLDSNPFDLTIDLTSACQLHCPYCSTGNGTISRPKNIMKSPLYDSIIYKIGEECFFIWYFSNGEPLLHKHFGEFLEPTKSLEIFSIISTNLSLKLSDPFLTKLLTSGLGIISVSLDGATEATYKQYRRGGSFDLVVDNIRRLVAMKQQLGLTYPLIEWRFLRFQHNEHEEAAARTLAAELGVDLLEFYPGNAPPKGSPDADGVFESSRPLQGPILSGPAFDTLFAQQLKTRVLARLVPSKQSDGGSSKTFTSKCDWLLFSGMLHPSGRVGPCCVYNDEDGDFVESFEDFYTYNAMFNSEKYIASRKMFATGGKSGTICDRCPNPAAQHYQFRMKLRAILRNAPDWVARTLGEAPERYFLPEDRLLVPEVAAIFANAASLAAIGIPEPV